MMSLFTAGMKLKRRLDDVLERKVLNACDVVLRWDGTAAPADVNLEAGYAAPSPQTATVRALVYFVAARTVLSGFTEFKAGDAIVSFAAGVDLQKRGLVFVLPPDSKEYVQMQTGKAVNELWDALVGGEALATTVILRQK